MSKYHSNWIERNNYYEEVQGENGTPRYRMYMRPVIVCMCGSTRFKEAWQAANLSETLAGRIVLSVGSFARSTPDDAAAGRFEGCTAEQKTALDWLHKRKIDLADEILVLNVDGYIGESTRSEVRHAIRGGKTVRWLEENAIPEEFAAK